MGEESDTDTDRALEFLREHFSVSDAVSGLRGFQFDNDEIEPVLESLDYFTDESLSDEDEEPDFEDTHLDQMAREQNQNVSSSSQVPPVSWKTLLNVGPTDLEEVKKKMDIPVAEDGLIRKRILQSFPGCKKVPSDGKVTIDYCGYSNGTNMPFDSTFEHGHPASYRLEPPGELIYGLRMCLKTMSAMETAQFFIPWQFAYGALGCPNRIPPKSDVVFNVRMHRFITPNKLGEFENLVWSEIEQLPFDTFMKGTKELFERGLALHEDSIRKAKKYYHECIDLLEKRRTTTDAEHDARIALQAIVHFKLAEIYIRLDKPAQACSQSHKSLLLNLDNGELKARAYFTYAQGKFKFEEYKTALRFVENAKSYGGYGDRLDALETQIRAKLAEDDQDDDDAPAPAPSASVPAGEIH